MFPLTGKHKPSHHPDSKPENQKHLQPLLATCGFVLSEILYYFPSVLMEYTFVFSKVDFDIFHQTKK